MVDRFEYHKGVYLLNGLKVFFVLNVDVKIAALSNLTHLQVSDSFKKQTVVLFLSYFLCLLKNSVPAFRDHS